jgi:hypothetical protein
MQIGPFGAKSDFRLTFYLLLRILHHELVYTNYQNVTKFAVIDGHDKCHTPHELLWSRVAPWFPVRMIHLLVAGDLAPCPRLESYDF